MNTRTMDLSEDVMSDILLRLPVKTLMRLKCVSKFLHEIVKNPTFISKHLKNKDDDNIHLIVSDFSSYGHGNPMFAFFPDETLANLSYEDLGHHVPTLLEPQSVWFMGPFDGLFCIYGKLHDRVILWNLATREFRLLPKLRNPLPRRTNVSFCNVGFQFYPETNDFKIIVLRNLFKDDCSKDYVSPYVSVYTLNRNYWIKLKAAELANYVCLQFTNESIKVDGICYWLAYRRDCQVILSVHVDNEEFQEIKEPNSLCEGAVTLGVIGNSLSLLYLDKIEKNFRVLVLKRNCWTAHLTIGPLLNVSLPYEFWKNGALFLRSSTLQLLFYDPNTEYLRDLGFIDQPHVKVHKYAESLIILNKEDSLCDPFDIPWHVLGLDSDIS